MWLQSVLAAREAMLDAVQLFHLTADKEIALKAAYRALGLDPRDAPTFGLGLMAARPPGVSVTQTNAPVGNVSPPARKAGRRLWRAAGAALLGAALLGGGGFGALGLAALLRAPAAAPQQPAHQQADPDATEWEIRWQMGPDGKWQTTVVPVKGK